MYLTTQEVLSLKSEVQTALSDFEYGRGKKRVPVIQGDRRIMLLYVVDLLTKLERMLKRGNYDKNRILTTLSSQDWEWYSYSSKALCGERKLKERLGIKPSKNVKITKMLGMQADYLKDACEYVVQRLEHLEDSEYGVYYK